MLRCVVIDDEPLAREVLQNYLERLDCVRSIRLFGHAQDALEYLRHHEADVLFLDIEMPELNGLDFLRALPQPPLTVFTTAYRHYAYEGFELGVIDFLLKPIAFARFRQAIDKIRKFLALKEQNSQLEAGPSLGTVFVKSGTQRIKLNLADVTYLQGLKDYTIIYTNASQIVLKGTLKSMHAIFPPSQFVRVHKSFIVARSRISRIEHNRLIINGNPVPIGRSYKEEIEALTARR